MRSSLLIILLSLCTFTSPATTYHQAKTHQQKDGLSSNTVRCIFKDNMGFMWFGTDNGIDRYDAATISSVREVGIGVNSISEIAGHLYVGTDRGLYEYDRKIFDIVKFSPKTEFNIQIVSPVKKLLSVGNVLAICTEGQGLFLYDRESGTLTQCSIGIPFITDVAASKEGTLYVSERDSGIHSVSLKGEYLSHIHACEGASCILYSDNSIYFASGDDSRSLSILKNGEIRTLELQHGINDIYYDGSETLILSCKKGIVKLGKDALIPEVISILTHGEDISNHSYNDVLKDEEGTLWVASSSNGIVKLPQNSIALRTHAKGEILFDSPSSSHSMSNFSDSEGKLLQDLVNSDMSTLSCTDKDGNTYKAVGNYSIYKVSPLGKTDVYYLLNNVSTIFCDHLNQVWAGTSVKGLWTLSGEEFVPFQINSSLGQASVIYSMQQDNEGYLWACTDIGIVKIDPKKKKQMTIIAADEAQSSDKFLPGASLKSSSGILYFGRENSILSFNPSDIIVNRVVPPVVLKTMNFTNGSAPVNLLHKKNIELSHDCNSFTIDFAVLSYQDPQNNSYSYCLSSVDQPDVWGKEHKAVYRNLKPGTYKFTVRGRNNDGTESEEIATLWITITPPWYSSTWAFIIYALIFIGVVIYAYHVWKKKLDNKYIGILNKGRETIEKEAYNQKMNFFLGMVHEIRTPMTMMKLSLDSLKKERTDDDGEAVQSIQENLEYMQDTVNGILNFHKRKSDGIRLVLSKTDLTRICRDLAKKFRETAKIKGLKLEISIPDEPVFVMADEPFLAKIIMNMLSNAFKYAKTTVALNISYDDGSVSVQVKDDGPGVKDSEKEKIFGMFYKAAGDKIAEASGLGVGLAYSRKLAEHHDGKLILEDNNEVGASFLLTIPMLHDVNLIEGNAVKNDNHVVQSPEKIKVIVADDNLQLLAKLEKELSQWYTVRTAYNGVEALKIIENESIDIIVSDVMMPIMDGVELCRTVKEKQELSHIPFILLTALSNVEDKAEGLKSGADAYVEKPFSVIQLHYQIDNLMKLRTSFQKTVKDAAGNPEAQPPRLNACDAEFVASINAAIDEQIRAEDFSIDALADTMCMSKTNFYRKFHAITGTSPNDYLKNYRLNRAASMIKDGARINEAAESVGFFSSSYFAKCFKAKFGVLPKDYKK